MAYTPSIPQVSQSGPRPTGYSGWLATTQPAPAPQNIDYAALARLIAAQQAQTPAPAAPPVQPFLTPQQQAQSNLGDFRNQDALTRLNQGLQWALSDYATKSQYATENAARSNQYAQENYATTMGNAQQSYATGIAASARSNALGGRDANAASAGRGLFQSSIQANDIQDLATTMALRNQALSTNLARISAAAQQGLQRSQDATNTNLSRSLAADQQGAARATVTTGENISSQGAMNMYNQNMYNLDRVNNAAAVTPVVPAPQNVPAPPPAPQNTGSPPSGYAGWLATPAGSKPQPYPTVSTQPYTPPPLKVPSAVPGAPSRPNPLS